MLVPLRESGSGIDVRSRQQASGDLRSFVVAAGRFLAGFPDPLEIPCVRTANTYGVVDAIAEAVRQDGVVHLSVAPLFLGAREVLVGRHPVAQVVGDRLEVARASKLLGAEAFGHAFHPPAGASAAVRPNP